MGRLQHPFGSDLITLLFPKIRARLSEHRSGGPRRLSSRCSGGPRRSSPRSQADSQENCIDFLVNSLLSPNRTSSATVQCSASSPLPLSLSLSLPPSIYLFINLSSLSPSPSPFFPSSSTLIDPPSPLSSLPFSLSLPACLNIPALTNQSVSAQFSLEEETVKF